MESLASQGFEISPQQKSLWLSCKAEERHNFRVTGTILIEGQLDEVILEKAIQKTIQNNEILRTGLKAISTLNVPVQIICDRHDFRLNYFDLTSLDAAIQEDRITEIVSGLTQTQFDLEQGIVFDASLIKLDREKSILAIAISAFCADAVSFDNLIREIIQTYQSCLEKEINNELLQYADLAAWQNELLEAPEAEAGRQYWQNKTLSHFTINKLPREKQVNGQLEFIPQLINFNISSKLVNQLELLAEQYNTSLATLLMACWQILLWRLTDRQIAVATCFDNRSYAELKPVIGLLAKYIPLGIKLEENLKLSQVLTQLDKEINQGKQWQEYFVDTSNNLPWEFAFEFERASKYTTNNLNLTTKNLLVCINRFKVKLACLYCDNTLNIQLHYDASLFEKQDIETLSWEYQTLLQSAVNNPKAAVAKLNILSPKEEQLLIEFNQTKNLISPYQCLPHWFEAQVNKTPDATAVIFEHEQLTYQELNTKADCIADHLISLGVKPETIIALCVQRSLDIVIGILGILKAGAAYLPLEPNLPTEALTFRLQDAQVPIILTQKHLAEKIEAAVIGTQNNIHIIDLDLTSASTTLPPHFQGASLAEGLWGEVASPPCTPRPLLSNNLAYIIYTSGSTGKPKGVAVEHRQIVNYINGVLAELKLPEAASFATVSTFAADLGNTSIFGALCTGGCLHIISDSKATDPVALADYFTRHQVDCLKIVPSHLSALLTSADAEKLLPRQRLILGGEAATWDLINKVHQLAPDCQIFNHYGPTETTVGVLINRINSVETFRPKGLALRREKPLLGYPLANTQIYILDKHQKPVPIGVPGEIYIGGANVARGYINQPELTTEKFISIPPAPLAKGGAESGGIEDRLYKTGDKARYHLSGKIEFLGRIDNQIKLHGYRIELGEIETVLRQHPQVRDAVVTVKENSSNKYLIAYFTAETEINEELPEFLSNKLPEYMLPSHFIQLKAFPLTSNGKIDRHSLPSPETIDLKSVAFVAPRTSAEIALTQIWTELLGREQVSIHDNFFELGGDSIISIQAIAKANQIGLRLTPKQIFEHQTIAELAAVVEFNHTLTSEQGLVTGKIPLTPIQHRFFEQDLAEPHHHNQSILLELSREIKREQLAEVINHLLQHHDVLRVRFFQEAKDWQSEITESIPEEFTQIDLSHVTADKQAIAIEEASTQVQSSLNLSAGKLIKIALFNLGKNKPNRLLIVIHHLAIDGVSWRILLEDFQTALTQVSEGKAIQLPPKTTSWKQWAEALEEYAQTEPVKAELDYWCLESRQQIKSLPVDNADGINTESVARNVSVSLGETQTQTLLQEVPAAYHTQINDILLASVVKAFARWTGESQLLVDLEGHGREDILADVNLSRTVGWFTTIFPVLLDLKEADSANKAIETIKEQLRQIPNRGIGYGLLRYLSQDKAIARLATIPQAEVCFNYLGQFDRSIANADWFKLAPESAGATRSPLGKRPYLFNINGYVIDGKLTFDWIYSSQIYQEQTVLNLAESFIQRLRDFIDLRFLEIENPTASDFPQANLNQQQLDLFLATLD